MKNRSAILTAAALLLAGALETGAGQQTAAKVPQELKITIDMQQTAPPVSPYEYGMFIEHIGTLIYRSLWSEMLDDRKFYFPIKPEESQAPPRAGRPLPQMQLRKWRPVGPDEAVVMDKIIPLWASRAHASNSTPRRRTVYGNPALPLSKGRSIAATSSCAGLPARR